MKTRFWFPVAAATMILTGCGNHNTTPPSQGTNTTSQTTNTTATASPAPPPGGYLGALMQADKYAVKTIDVSYLNQAIQLFNTQEGRLPKDLNELVPNYVGKLPEAPSGSKIVYDPGSGTVTVVKQ